jgi:hypothetical protein
LFRGETEDEFDESNKKNADILMYEVDYKHTKGKETLKQIYEIDYFIIFPDMKLKQHWDIVIMILILVSAIVTPWRLAYVESADNFWWILTDALIDMLFI